MTKRIITLAATVSAVALHAQAWSQTDAAPQATSSGLGDIVVTAQKREQAINDVPLSIIAASGEKLANQGITDTTVRFAGRPRTFGATLSARL
ncbi:outer membrane receptor protein involved in Fe transport [Sphingobium xenophagum]|uniref:Outer membrane receptor protein involved in Fe transport n=1 Tax=Sphingobium xenophagum TaxID=121428 RepID=A0ABU1WYS1_SPHXE|nr:hypothetical protein [Sphingobium xenophagum]MDR7154066.1 outer membrane receptor protein involved in Fe transport [Sphingobium xenophagum]